MLQTHKSRCFKVVGCSTLEVWFHKSGIIAVTAFSFFVDSYRDQLNLDRFEFLAANVTAFGVGRMFA
ncbi:hypothetical protein VII_000702 [Vibrio mimicus MB451]|nr:hypothetical protein VII_000670 [Vibrio mimicus MB451]EEY36957.1 hypothetical protein VII_000702 [Vibrio mimicus MB451]